MHRAAADRDLVLAVLAGPRGEHSRQQLLGRGVGGVRQVDQPAPRTGTLQRRDPPESPELGLVRARHRIGGSGPHRAARGDPYRRRRRRVAERAQQIERRRQRGRHGRPAGKPGVAEREQGQHARDRRSTRVPPQPFREGLRAVRSGRDSDDVGAVRAEGPFGGGHPGLSGAFRPDQQPSALQFGGRDGDGRPFDAIPPVVQVGRRGRRRPVAFALERVGGQVDGLGRGIGEDRVPSHLHSSHV
ncbi:hypothetical protein LUX57_51455 [Actinomadura madurae]|uniref:hypothetical protein n=1 Tax=Actinomadura madurae TaxID=1993 RepID=UPI0020D24F2F|nr:hypothetical protein [Actinomadura madurae]MCP9972482.1 hypothetical protein [Actinomadura madurae]